MTAYERRSSSSLPARITAQALHALVACDREIALLDVRERGEFAAGHLFLASSVPMSRFEPELLRLVPRLGTTLVLCDDGQSGRAEWAASLASDLGYTNVLALAGGTQAWRSVGYQLFEGVYVPSKAFGEILEKACHVPSISAPELDRRRRAGERILLIDGRPADEHANTNVPGSLCLPNGDLAYRIGEILKDDTTPVVVHCAGRTRSIIGAQTLRNLGLKNPVFALENGTQGWALAGLELERGSLRLVSDTPDKSKIETLRARAETLAGNWGVLLVPASHVVQWLREPLRTTYVLDVRSPDEYQRGHPDGVDNAPGGQLVQATDQYLAVRGARVVLVDDNIIRAVVTANWLRQMGWEASALAEGTDGWQVLEQGPRRPLFGGKAPPLVDAKTLARHIAEIGKPLILDLRPSQAFRRSHLKGAKWATRSNIEKYLKASEDDRMIVLVTHDNVGASLVARDLGGADRDIRLLSGDLEGWSRSGLSLVSTPLEPSDQESIDFIFFTHDRHSGNLDAARKYLAWEQGLISQLEPHELAIFKPMMSGKDVQSWRWAGEPV